MADIYGMMRDSQNAFLEGEQRGQQRGLSRLMSQAMQAPREQQGQLVAQMAATSPQAAFDASRFFSDQQDDHREEMGRYAMAFDALPEEQKAVEYPRFAMEMQRMGLPAPPQWDPAYGPRIKQFASAWGGMQEQQMAPRVIGDALVDASGNILYQAPQEQQYQWSESNGAWIPKPMAGAPQQAEGPSGGAAQMLGDAYAGALPAEQVQPTIKQLAAKYGGVVSSLTRTAEHNRAVGGVPNSQHISGTAGDVVIRDPAAKAAFIREAEAHGLKVIDEGDHLHTQMRRGPAQAGLQAIPVAGIQPKGDKPKAPPSGYRYAADGLSLEPIPGGPAEVAAAARADAAAARKAAEAAKADQKAQAAQARQMESATAAGDLVARIDELTQSGGFKDLGTALGDIKINTPLYRSDAKDAQAKLKNIAGQVAIATMARLRALSAQGATGFGALSKEELKLLENSIATLQSDQVSNKQLSESLKIIRDKMQKVADWKAPYTIGQIIEHGGKKYRVTGLSDPNDPDVEEVR